MPSPTGFFGPLSLRWKSLARSLLAIGGNRLELFVLEAKESQDHLLRSVFLIVGVGVCALLSGLAFSAFLVILFWDQSPLQILLGFTALNVCVGLFLGLKLKKQIAASPPFAASLDQCRKDGATLEKILQ
jgi:uncharacterized membrane protein YqjE